MVGPFEFGSNGESLRQKGPLSDASLERVRNIRPPKGKL